MCVLTGNCDQAIGFDRLLADLDRLADPAGFIRACRIVRSHVIKQQALGGAVVLAMLAVGSVELRRSDQAVVSCDHRLNVIDRVVRRIRMLIGHIEQLLLRAF